MVIQIAAFTEQGKKTAYRISTIEEFEQAFIYDKYVMSLKEWTEKGFINKSVIVFVGATGIAVRTIAPYVLSKLTDSPVIVVDELGKFVIPLLSGHVGGANEIANVIAKELGAIPVITTATDINNVFAVDVFAVKNRLSILDKDGIVKISSKLLKEEKASIYFHRMRGDVEKIPKCLEYVDDIEKYNADIIISRNPELLRKAIMPLKPKDKVLGIGCKRGKSCREIEEFVKELMLDIDEVCAIASIDVKKDEPGIIEFANKNRLQFYTYTKEQLMSVEGDFNTSDFVKSQVGVDNVCERAAILCAGDNSKIIQEKIARDGITLAIAEREWRIEFDYE